MSPPIVSEIKPLPASKSKVEKEQERVQYVMHPFLGDAASPVNDKTVGRETLKTAKDSTEGSPGKTTSLPCTPAPPCNEALVNEENESQPNMMIHSSLRCIASTPDSSPLEPQNKVKSESVIVVDRTKPVGNTASIEHIVHPEPTDVLFGRGKPYQGHSGNQKLREIVDKYKDAYMSSRRYDKLAIAEDIVKGIQGGRWGEAGRFLRRADNGEDFWVVAPDEEAREKVSHALRGKKKTYAATPQEQHSNEKKERKVNTGNVVEEYLRATGGQKLKVLRTTQDQIALETNNSPAIEIRLPESGATLGMTNDRQLMSLLAGNMQNRVMPGGGAGVATVPSLELQSLLMPNYLLPNRQQQLLHQQILSRDGMTSSLFGGGEERNVAQDLSSVANSNRFLAAQLGLLSADHSLTAPSSFLPHDQQALGHQQPNPSADIFGSSQTVAGDGRVISDVSPLISALLGERVGTDGARGQQSVVPGSTLNIADVIRDLQQERDQRALAELILRSRGNSGAFGANTYHQS